jgi:hypothetical protein
VRRSAADESRFPSCHLLYGDLVNARYNSAGQALSPDFRLPVETGCADISYMWGVVTNMEPDHLPVYAEEIARMRVSGGICT